MQWFADLIPNTNMVLISFIPLLQQNATPNKVSNMFAGTRDKCVGCKKTVYPIEKVISVAIPIIVIIFINSRDVWNIIYNV